MLWAFFRRHVLQSAVIVAAAVIAIYGPIADAYQLWTAGLPWQVWMAVGMAIFFAVVVVILASVSGGEVSAATDSTPDHVVLASDLRTSRRNLEALYQDRGRASLNDVRRFSSSFESILTALEKKGFKVPRMGDATLDPAGYLGIAIEYADRVAPELGRGHVAEAKTASARMVEKFKEYEASKHGGKAKA